MTYSKKIENVALSKFVTDELKYNTFSNLSMAQRLV